MYNHPYEKVNTRENIYDPIPSEENNNFAEEIKPNTFLKIVKLSNYIKRRHFITYLFAVFFTISFYVFVNSSSGYILTNFLHIPKRLQGKKTFINLIILLWI